MPVTVERGPAGPHLRNPWLAAHVNEPRGTLALTDAASGRALVPAAYAAVEWTGPAPRRTETRGLGLAAGDPVRVSDAHGPGAAVRLQTLPCSGSPALALDLTLYDHHPFAALRLTVTNTLPAPVRIHRLHPFVAARSPRGRLALGGDPADWTVYQHGWQSWSPAGAVSGRDLPYPDLPPVLAPDRHESAPGVLTSRDASAARSPATGGALTLGFATARNCFGEVRWHLPDAAVDARCPAGLDLDPGAALSSETLLVDLSGDPNAALARFGDALAREMGAVSRGHVPAGWCSWYYYFTDVTEADVIENLDFLAANRETLPLEYVQLDDGYQADIGDWTHWNEKFPHGPRWLADRIRAAGLRPGLWLAPFLVAESSRLCRRHPDWLVRDDHDRPVVAIHNWDRDCYALDTAHPDALAWLQDLFRTVVRDWGYPYVKIDFVFAAAVAGRRHNPSVTPLAAYRRGVEAIRRAAGREAFILGCGAPIGPSAGLVDGMRIGPDVAPWWRFRTTATEPDALLEERRRTAGHPATENAVRNTLTRSWTHRRLWLNDPDCLMVRDSRTKLTEAEVRSLATAIALSGGMVLLSDRLPDVPPERLRIVSQLLPPLGRSAVPVDLMDREVPSLYALDLDEPWDRWRLVAAFNWDDAPAAVAVPLDGGPAHAFEFWTERYLGVHNGSVTVPDVPPHGAALLALRPVADRPQVVGTTLHASQGAAEIADAAWDGRRLALRLRPAPARRGAVYVATGGRRLASASGPLAAPAVARHGLAVLPVHADRPADLVLEFTPEE